MKRNMLAATVAAAVTMTAGMAHAGPATDDLSQCLVQHTTKADRVVLVRWIFAAIASNPKVSNLAQITPEQGRSFSAGAAGLMQRLLLDDCHAQTVAALRENPQAPRMAFEVLGKVAAEELMADPSVASFMSGLDPYVDQGRINALMEEAKKPE